MKSVPCIISAQAFPHPCSALTSPNGLLAYSFHLSQELLLNAYWRGIFPWFAQGDPVLWWSPEPRAVFYTQQFKPSKNLRKLLRQQKFTVTLNQNFLQVIEACAETRIHQEGTWITEEMIRAYYHLHLKGFAHSIEVWEDNQLVGGLYGLSFGLLFFGESMFHKKNNTSKIAFCYLNELCRKNNFPIIDAQLPNSHLENLGATPISRIAFLDYLYRWRNKKTPSNLWQPKELTFNHW